MKPCSGNRKNIALFAANALDVATADKLREHIAICAGCREYLGEISGVASRLSGTREVFEIEASEGFHQTLTGRIRAIEKEPLAHTAAAYLRLLKWHILIPIAGLALLFGIGIELFHKPSGISTQQTIVKPAAADAGAGDESPTFANYQKAANQSFEALDSLLTRQAKEGPPPAQIYHASATSLAQEQF